MKRCKLTFGLIAAGMLATAACGTEHNEKRAPLPTATPAADETTPPCDSAKGGPLLGGGGRC